MNVGSLALYGSMFVAPLYAQVGISKKNVINVGPIPLLTKEKEKKKERKEVVRFNHYFIYSQCDCCLESWTTFKQWWAYFLNGSHLWHVGNSCMDHTVRLTLISNSFNVNFVMTATMSFECGFPSRIVGGHVFLHSTKTLCPVLLLHKLHHLESFIVYVCVGWYLIGGFRL